jgi:hypothetical protein
VAGAAYCKAPAVKGLPTGSGRVPAGSLNSALGARLRSRTKPGDVAVPRKGELFGSRNGRPSTSTSSERSMLRLPSKRPRACGAKTPLADEQVVDRPDFRFGRHPLGPDAQVVASEQGVEERVVRQIERIIGPVPAFGAVGNQLRVIGSVALADDVADHPGQTAVRELEFVRSTAVGAVDQQVVKDGTFTRPRFEQVTAKALLKATSPGRSVGRSCRRKAGGARHRRALVPRRTRCPRLRARRPRNCRSGFPSRCRRTHSERLSSGLFPSGCRRRCRQATRAPLNSRFSISMFALRTTHRALPSA